MWGVLEFRRFSGTSEMSLCCSCSGDISRHQTFMTVTFSLGINRLCTVHEINVDMIMANFLMYHIGTQMTHKPQPGCGLMWKEGPSCVDQLLTYMVGWGLVVGGCRPHFTDTHRYCNLVMKRNTMQKYVKNVQSLRHNFPFFLLFFQGEFR